MAACDIIRRLIIVNFKQHWLSFYTVLKQLMQTFVHDGLRHAQLLIALYSESWTLSVINNLTVVD